MATLAGEFTGKCFYYYYIVSSPVSVFMATLNKRTELTGKCRHKNKYKLKNFT